MHSSTHSPASDVFALAVTLNELTTITPPYSDCTRDGPPGLHTVLDRGYTRCAGQWIGVQGCVLVPVLIAVY